MITVQIKVRSRKLALFSELITLVITPVGKLIQFNAIANHQQISGEISKLDYYFFKHA